VNVLRDVRQVQAQLYLLKLLAPRTEVDGIYGGNTEAGIRTFQQRESLPVTGIADEATRQRLLQRVM
jgi:peptidoglycan hydrolase-like protein with peptidoglycan-binding domain